MLRTVASLLVLVLGLAGCTSPAPDPTRSTSATDGFPPGVYYLDRTPVEGSALPARLVRADGAEAPAAPVFPFPYDLRPNRLVTTDQESTLHMKSPKGNERHLRLDGLEGVAHPSSAPEYRRLAIEAVRSSQEGFQYGVYVVSVQDGQRTQLTGPGETCRAPRWKPGSEAVFMTCVAPSSELRLVDATNGTVLARWPDAGTLVPAVSGDGTRFLQGERLRILDLGAGAEVASLSSQALARLRELGWQPQEDAVPMSADLSPDGASVVFDGLARQGDRQRVLLMEIRSDGSGFRILREVEPPADGSMAPLHPRWIGEN